MAGPKPAALVDEDATAADYTTLQLGAAIRQRRQLLGLTLDQLSQTAGLSVGFISRIERNKATPSLGSVAALAAALGTTVDAFVAAPPGSKNISRPSDRTEFTVGTGGVHYAKVSAAFPGQTMASFLMKVPAGFSSEASRHSGEELIHVLSGTLQHSLEGELFTLQAGDVLHFPSNSLHSYTNPGPDNVVALWVGTTPFFL